MSKFLAAILLATPVSAAFMDYSATYLEFMEVEFENEIPRLNPSFSASIPRFNPALGTLRFVSVGLDLRYEWSWTVKPNGPEEVSRVSCSSSWLTGYFGQPGYSTLMSEYVNSPEFGDCGVWQPDGSLTGGGLPRQTYWRQFSSDDPYSQIGFFIGYVPIPFQAGFYFTGYPATVTGGPYSGVVSLRIDSAATVFYDYEEAPEPLVLVTVGIGLAGIGGLQRWRKRGVAGSLPRR